MALVLRRLGRVELARSFYRDIKNNNDYFHFAVGRTLPWTDDTVPETPVDSDAYVSEFRRSMMFTQRIDSADICMLADRTDWVSGTVYDEYDDTYSSVNQSNSGAQSLAEANFFVVTDEFKVYKCISNNSNGASTEKPTSTGTSVFELADGYNWKFMFQISASDQNKFLDADYVPVRKLTGNPTHDVNGEIDSITMTAGGSGYTSVPTAAIVGDGTGATGTATISGGAVTGVTITASGSGYSFAFVAFTGGGGSNAAGTVNLGDVDSLPALQSAVEGAAVAGTLDRVVLTTGGQDYATGDVVVSVTGDGTGAEAAAYVNETTGALTKLRVTNPGSGYSYASIVITNTTAPGTGATARAIISPQGGHGSNATRELFANNLGLTVSFADNTNKDLILGNDFRQIALIKNVLSPAAAIYTTNTGTASYIITVADATALANYEIDNKIVTDDGGEFTVVQLDSTNNKVWLAATIPTITNSSTLENTTRSLTGLSINSVTSPEVDNATGEIIYLDNRSPITRSEDQVEQIKALIRF
jgi:hypothetical protein